MSNRGVEQHKFLTKKGYLFNFLTKNGKNKEKLQRNYRKVHQNVGLIFSSNEKKNSYKKWKLWVIWHFIIAVCFDHTTRGWVKGWTFFVHGNVCFFLLIGGIFHENILKIYLYSVIESRDHWEWQAYLNMSMHYHKIEVTKYICSLLVKNRKWISGGQRWPF